MVLNSKHFLVRSGNGTHALCAASFSKPCLQMQHIVGSTRTINRMTKRFSPKKGSDPNDNPDKEKLEIIKKYVKKNCPPTSSLLRLVCAFLDQCPDDAIGKRGFEFDMLAWEEQESRSTIMQTGFKEIRMCRSKFTKWLEIERPLLDEDGRRDECGRLFQLTPDEHKTMDRPVVYIGLQYRCARSQTHKNGQIEGQQTKKEVNVDDIYKKKTRNSLDY